MQYRQMKIRVFVKTKIYTFDIYRLFKFIFK